MARRFSKGETVKIVSGWASGYVAKVEDEIQPTHEGGMYMYRVVARELGRPFWVDGEDLEPRRTGGWPTVEPSQTPALPAPSQNDRVSAQIEVIVTLRAYLRHIAEADPHGTLGAIARKGLNT